MRIGTTLNVNQSQQEITDQISHLHNAGFQSAWASQIFGHDALTALAVAGSHVPGIELGTAVVPIYPRHPMMLAAQALTVQQATGGRLALGIGLSHQVVVEGCWGLSFDRPARYMREYLAALMPLLHGQQVDVHGEVLTARTFAPLEHATVTPPPVIVAALGATMLDLAGTVADGTATWMTGRQTVADHIAPRINAAAEAAGRPAPRVVVSLPVCVTDDTDAAAELINTEFAIYPTLPSYKAMLELEGATAAADVALLGTAEEVLEGLGLLAEAGATDFVASICGTRDERQSTFELLAQAARG